MNVTKGESVGEKETKVSWGTWVVRGLVAASLALIASVFAGDLLQTPFGLRVAAAANVLFSLSSPQLAWYVTRAAGIIAYLLLWLSTVYGLAMPSKLFDKVLHRGYTMDFHEFLSLLSIGFLVLHIVVLTADQYLPYSLAQLLLPFLSSYRPLWVSVGAIAFYLTLLVTVTFYLRNRIGMKAFRAIHLASFVAYFGGAVHGLFSGTDSTLPTMQLMYAVTFLVVVALTGYWLSSRRKQKTAKANARLATEGRSRA
jgi:predicted ferric reductase